MSSLAKAQRAPSDILIEKKLGGLGDLGVSYGFVRR
jgi:hypothetical protein